MQQQHCRGTRRDGTPCRAPARPSGYCWAHDPALTAKRDAARVAGGRGKSNASRAEQYMPASLRPILGKLVTALDETHEGTLTPSQAQAMASIASAIVRVHEVAEIERRLEDMEAKAARAAQGSGGAARWPA